MKNPPDDVDTSYRWAANHRWERIITNGSVWSISSPDKPITDNTIFVVDMKSLGWQVWIKNEPASRYFKEFDDAAEEAIILMAETALEEPKRQPRWNRKSLKAAGAWRRDDEDFSWDDD
jgi:hypothetical protein